MAILNVRIDRETELSADTCSPIPTGNHWVVFVIDMSALVYAKSEEDVIDKYAEVKLSNTFQRHSHFAKYFDSTCIWQRRREWATSYRLRLLTRGNSTNNYAEVGFRIFQDIICQRTKAFNLVQLFQFITVNLEQSYELRLLNIGDSRFDRALSV